MDKYISLPKDIIFKSEIVVNKSRFLGFAKMVDNVLDANNFIKDLKKEYSDSKHIVYAYKLFNATKSCDDGEPSGTAGRPILELINHKQAINIVVAVVRYFGGIKLGTGGLVRAYTDTALMTIEDKLVDWKEYKEYKLTIDYSGYQDFLGWIKNKNIKIKDVKFDNTIEALVLVLGDYDMPKECEFIKTIFDIA